MGRETAGNANGNANGTTPDHHGNGGERRLAGFRHFQHFQGLPGRTCGSAVG